MHFLNLFSYIILLITLIYSSYIIIGDIKYDIKYKDQEINVNIKKDDFYIIVPVYNEDIEIFKAHINAHKDYNILYVLNGNLGKYKEILEENNINYLYIEEKNKKKAVWTGLEYIKNYNPKYVILLDSDTFLTEKDIKAGIYYLKNYDFSALSFNILFYGNIIWNEVFKLLKSIYIYSQKGFSGNGSQLSLNGECIMGKFIDIYESYKKLIEKYSNKRIGDDQILSSILLNNGKKIFYIDHYYVIAKGITSFSEFIKKNIRYSRVFVYLSIINIKEKYILKRGFFYILYMFIYSLPILIYPYILYNSIYTIVSIKFHTINSYFLYFIRKNFLSDFLFLYHYINNHYIRNYFFIFHLFYIIMKYFIISFYSIIIYLGYKKFSGYKSSIFYYMIASFILPFVLFYSLFTFFKDDWLTR